jgi:hypothetical protein
MHHTNFIITGGKQTENKSKECFKKYKVRNVGRKKTLSKRTGSSVPTVQNNTN